MLLLTTVSLQRQIYSVSKNRKKIKLQATYLKFSVDFDSFFVCLFHWLVELEFLVVVVLHRVFCEMAEGKYLELKTDLALDSIEYFVFYLIRKSLVEFVFNFLVFCTCKNIATFQI